MKKKKKQKTPVLYLIIAFIFGIAWGTFTVEYIDLRAPEDYLLSGTLFFVLLIYFFIFIQTIVHEAGHLIFGLLTGYKFVSFRIGNFMWVKTDGKIRLKRFSLAGTAGQCIMAPPDMKDGKIPCVLYNLGGSLLNLITGVIFGIFAVIFYDNFIVSFILFNAVFAGVLMALLNGIPMHTATVDNDGMNAWSLGKNPKALRAFWIQLKVEQFTAQGVSFKNMPADWFALPDPEDIDNSLVASLGYFSYLRFLDEGKFNEAYDLSRLYVCTDSAMPGIYKSLLTCELVYLELILGRNEINIDTLYDAKLAKFVKVMKTNFSVMRMEYTYALLIERDIIKAEKIKNRFEKTASKHPYPVEIQNERKYLNIATEKFRTVNN